MVLGSVKYKEDDSAERITGIHLTYKVIGVPNGTVEVDFGYLTIRMNSC